MRCSTNTVPSEFTKLQDKIDLALLYVRLYKETGLIGKTFKSSFASHLSFCIKKLTFQFYNKSHELQ